MKKFLQTSILFFFTASLLQAGTLSPHRDSHSTSVNHYMNLAAEKVSSIDTANIPFVVAPVSLIKKDGGHPSGNRLFTDPPFDPGFGDNVMLRAVLTGNNEVPAVTTNATALVTMYFDGDRTKAKVNITATGLSGPITGVHIHEGDPGTNGPVLYPLSNEGNRVQMEVTNISGLDLISLMNGATYVNIHTAAHPDGEIRGQLILDQDYSFLANMNGEQEVPSVATTAIGLSSIHYTLGTLSLEINVQLSGLSSAITGVHLHTGILGENGPVFADLTSLVDGNTLYGKVDVATFQNILDIANGNAYINVHTVNNPDGEIRGQLNFVPGITFDGWMSASQENPATTSTGTGLAIATIYPSVNDIAVWMLADNVTGPINNAHLHHGSLGENGGVVHDLSADLSGNSLVHLGVVEDGFLGDLLRGEIYINAHTDAFSSGEIRGQLFRLARDGYGFDLCTEQEVGTINAPGSQGSGWMSVDRLHTNVNLAVIADQLTGPLTQSHIHQGAIGANGPVIVDLTFLYQGNLLVVNGATADTALINSMRAGQDYINIHTEQFPSGEIRGQIVKESLCPLETGIDPIDEIANDVQLSPVPVIDQLQLNIDMLRSTSLKLSVIDIAGRQLSTMKVDANAGANTFFVPVEKLLPGFYSLIISDGSVTQAFKFIK